MPRENPLRVRARLARVPEHEILDEKALDVAENNADSDEDVVAVVHPHSRRRARGQMRLPYSGLINDAVPSKAAMDLRRMKYWAAKKYFDYLDNNPNADSAELVIAECKPWADIAHRTWRVTYAQWNRVVDNISLTESTFEAYCYAYVVSHAQGRFTMSQEEALNTQARMRMIIREWNEFAPEHVDTLPSIFEDVLSALFCEPVPSPKKALSKFSLMEQEEEAIKHPEMDPLNYDDPLQHDPLDTTARKNWEEVLDGQRADDFGDYNPDRLRPEEHLALWEYEQVSEPEPAPGDEKRDTKQSGDAAENDDILDRSGLKFRLDEAHNAITIEEEREEPGKYLDHRKAPHKGNVELYRVEKWDRALFLQDASRLFYWHTQRQQYYDLHGVIHRHVENTGHMEKLMWQGLNAASGVEITQTLRLDTADFYLRMELACGGIENYLRLRPMSRDNVVISNVVEMECGMSHSNFIVENTSFDLKHMVHPDSTHAMKETWIWMLWSAHFQAYLGDKFCSAQPMNIVPDSQKAKMSEITNGPVAKPMPRDTAFFVFFDDIPYRMERLMTKEETAMELRRPLIIRIDNQYHVQNIRQRRQPEQAGRMLYRELWVCKDAVQAIAVWRTLMAQQFRDKLVDGSSITEAMNAFLSRQPIPPMPKPVEASPQAKQ